MDLVQGRRGLQMGAAIGAGGNAGSGATTEWTSANGRSLHNRRPAAHPPFLPLFPHLLPKMIRMGHWPDLGRSVNGKMTVGETGKLELTRRTGAVATSGNQPWAERWWAKPARRRWAAWRVTTIDPPLIPRYPFPFPPG